MFELRVHLIDTQTPLERWEKKKNTIKDDAGVDLFLSRGNLEVFILILRHDRG